MKSGGEQASELITDQHEAGAHQGNIGGVGIAQEASSAPPESHHDENSAEGQQLADLNADIECQEIGDQAVRRNLVLDDLGRETEAMKEAEDQRRRFGIGLEAKPTLVSAEVIQRLVDDGEADDGIDHVAVDANVEVHPEQHRRGVPKGEEADVDSNVLHPIEEEDHP